jgi:hypothetical protein
MGPFMWLRYVLESLAHTSEPTPKQNTGLLKLPLLFELALFSLQLTSNIS